MSAALVGGVLGAGVGATASANPAFGALVGGSAGAAIGSAIGIATTPPLPSYTPIAVPAAPVIPGFYDTWPPGYRRRRSGCKCRRRRPSGARNSGQGSRPATSPASAGWPGPSRGRAARPAVTEMRRTARAARVARWPACSPAGLPAVRGAAYNRVASAPARARSTYDRRRCRFSRSRFPLSTRSRSRSDPLRSAGTRSPISWACCSDGGIASHSPTARRASCDGATSTISWSGRRSASCSAAGSATCCSTIRPIISRTRSRRSISGTAGCRFTAARSA